MNPPSRAVLRDLPFAAYLHASGAGWEVIAHALKRNVERCKCWPRLYHDLWMEHLALGFLLVHQEGWEEAKVLLIKLMLEEKNEKHRRSLAKRLGIALDTRPAK